LEEPDEKLLYKRMKKRTKCTALSFEFCKILLVMLVSNFNMFIYLLMIICMIMNGNLLALVYPISIFAYALYEEGRPSKKYWQLVIMYSMIVIIVKFLVQTYPLTQVIAYTDETGTSINDYFITWRIGIEVIEGET
jgi:hypothetical protein